MIASFKNFIQNETDKFSLFVEEEGMSTPKMLFPITQPLANLLSLIPSMTLKADALNWIVTEGLMEASKGREKLLDKVREEIQTRMAMQSEMAREVMHKSNENVKSQDLFSQEALERLPILKDIIIEGKSISDYYEENYEPKLMHIDVDKTKSGSGQIVIDLKELAKDLESHGLKPFKYGGFDGYIQRVEKGDYLPDSEKRSAFSANNQQGLDLRPEKKLVNGKEVNVDDLKGYNKKKTGYVYNFHGGSTARDIDRAKDAISVLRAAFVSIVDKIDDPEHEIWRELIKQGKIKKIDTKEVEANDADLKLGKEEIFKRLGLNSGILPDFMSKEDFDFIIGNGLEQIQKGEWKNYMNMEVSSDKGGAGFSQAKSKDELKPGSYFIDGKNVYYMFTKYQIEEILNKVNKYYPKFPLQIKFSGSGLGSLEILITTKKNGSSYTRANDNIAVLIETQFNNGYKFLKDHSDGDAKNVIQKIQNILNKFHTYESKGYDKYIFDKEVRKIKVDPFNDQDPKIIELKNAGYEWNTKFLSPKEKEEGNPIDSEGNAYSILKYGNRKYRDYTLTNGKINYYIIREGDDYFLFIPLNKKGSGIEPQSHGALGRTMLASPDNYLFNAGEMGEHIGQNPLSEKDYESFKKKFEKEYGKGEDIIKAQFVKTAIIRARNSAGLYDPKQLKRKIEGSVERKGYDEAIMDSWTDAWEGIRAISGDRAFHVGFLDPEELNVGETDEFAINIKENLNKITEDEGFTNYIIDWLKKAPFEGVGIDWSSLENTLKPLLKDRYEVIFKKIKEAVYKNANEGRTRLLSRFLLSTMMRKIDKVGAKSKSISGNADYSGTDLSSNANDHRLGFRNSGMGIAGFKNREDVAKSLKIDLDAKGDPSYVKPRNSTIKNIEDKMAALLKARREAEAKAKNTLPPQASVAQAQADVAQTTSSIDELAAQLKAIKEAGARTTLQPQANVTQAQASVAQTTSVEDKMAALLKARRERKVESNNGNLFKDYNNWRSLREMAGSFAVSTNKKPKDGDGWNWWGAKGDKSGISISGEVDNVKTNPTGKKNAKKR